MKRFFLSLACLLFAVSVRAETIAPGLSVSQLAPVLPGGSTTSTFTAINPATGDTWMSNGQKLFRLGLGDWVQEIDLIATGALGVNQVTTALAFDSLGRFYVTNFTGGQILRSVDGSSWEVFAFVDRARDFEFNAAGNLIAIGGNGDPTQLGHAWSISPLGVVTDFADTQGETFTFSGDDLIIPHYVGTGIDRLTLAGNLTTLFAYERPVPILFEALAISALGNYVVSVNLGADITTLENQSKVIRIDGLTGLRTDLVTDRTKIGVDMFFRETGDLDLSDFGSLIATEISGNLDTAGLAVPEPSSLMLAGIGAVWLYGWRRNRK